MPDSHFLGLWVRDAVNNAMMKVFGKNNAINTNIINLQKSAFGSLSTSEDTPIVNVEFSYGIHSDLVITRLNNGTASVENNMLKLSTGVGANRSAQLFTKIPIKYYAGIGVVAEFTALFTSGRIGSRQSIGIGDSGDFLAFEFNDLDFGILRRNGGNPEIRSIQVTTKSTTAEDITITLDGDVDTGVTVTDASAGDATTTANDIAAHDFSNLGRGWKAIPNGDMVNFISYSSEPRTGTYSLSGATTAVGTPSQKLAGVSPINNPVKQTAWSEDRFLYSTDPDNSPSRITLDHEKGNIFRIIFGWLGFDLIAFFIKSPSTRDWIFSHIIEYANANTIPSLNNPTLPICAIVENTSNTTDMVLRSGSMGGFIQGKQPPASVKHVVVVDVTFTDQTLKPVITFHNNGVYQSKLNRIRMKITSVTAEVDSGKSISLEVSRDSTLTGASFAPHDVSESVALIDITATGITGGSDLDAFTASTVGKGTGVEGEFIDPTEFITISGRQIATGTNSVTRIVIKWEEDH